jgi:lipopolysaccharide/colanic/teichoic acid biosynthesis glycosyltransferase
MTIADESLFKRLLLLERRRAERTGARFALMLVDMEELSSKLNAGAMDDIGRAIGSTMRETDVVGWYRHSAVLGVILTTLNGAARLTLESVVSERARAILSRHPAAASAEHIWISCHIFPDDESTARKPPEHRFSASPDKEGPAGRSGTLKRVVDVSGSVVALLLLSPVLLTIAALVKATSKGPAFFRQQRIGQAGAEFTFLKFRSMHVNSDPAIHQEYVRKLISHEIDESDGTYKIKNDPRVTRIGRFLRKTSLDELPQFINVLKGDMSLVGPRPPIPYEFENYSLWHRRRILEARPGLTGLWQVSGRSRTTFDDMVRMDLRYIREQSLWLDVKILFKTPLAVIKGNGAY